MSKSVRIHDDTHLALKKLKAKRRSASMDRVIREIIREATGSSVEEGWRDSSAGELTKYLEA